MYFTPIQLHAVQVYMNYHFIKTCRADCFELSVMSTDLFSLFIYCMFCLLMSGLVIFTLENFVFSGCAFLLIWITVIAFVICNNLFLQTKSYFK